MLSNRRLQERMLVLVILMDINLKIVTPFADYLGPTIHQTGSHNHNRG